MNRTTASAKLFSRKYPIAKMIAAARTIPSKPTAPSKSCGRKASIKSAIIMPPAMVNIFIGLTSNVRGDALQRDVPLDCGVRLRC